MPAEAYTNRYGVIKPGEAPAIPTYRRTFKQRRALSMKQCEEPGPHKGRARRQKREWQSRDMLDFLGALASGAPHQPTRGGGSYTLRELLDGGPRERPAWVRRMQSQARHLYQLAEGHGPASGWGIAQPTSGAKGNAMWTPYWIPKAGEKCWRWWRRVARTLADMLDVLARGLEKAVPLHRHRLEQVAAWGERGSSTEREKQLTTGCRDRFADEPGPLPVSVARAIERARAKQPPDTRPGTEEETM